MPAERDFASLLDDLLRATEAEEPTSASPSLRFDLLAQIERLQAENPAMSEAAARAAYRTQPRQKAGSPVHPAAEPQMPDDRESIERELGIKTRVSRAELDRIRRDFALHNHPDRVSEQLRQRAIVRMQIANMLIDEARERLHKR